MRAFEILCVIAWRNLWRNRRRTLLTAGTISGGLALLLVFFGLGDGGHRQMLQNAVRMGGAHVAVQARDYQEKKAIELTLPLERLNSIAAVLSQHGLDSALLAPRVFASGLASSSDGSTSVSIEGIDPAAEGRVSALGDRVALGHFLRGGSAHMAVIGQGVARKLKLAPGEKFVLMAQGPGSTEIQSLLVHVAGVMRTGVDEIDQFAVLVPLTTAWTLLGLTGRIHQIGIILEDPGQTKRAVEAIRASVGPDVEVLDWEDLMPGLRDLFRIDVAGLFVIEAVFFLIIAFLIMNTLLMSVLERRREFVLLDAVGLTPVQRFLLIMLETLWIGVFSVVSGTTAGYAGHSYFRYRGLPLSLFFEHGFSAGGTAMEQVVHSALAVSRIGEAAGSVFLLTVLLALLPAWKAATEADVHLLGQA
jgi:ABC-type lipoprotein release transport system permease subunit